MFTHGRLIAGFVLLASAITATADVFTFAWKDGDSFIEKSHREVNIEIPGTEFPGAPKLSSVEDSRIEWRAGKTDAGFKITRTVKSETRKMTGEDLPEDPAKKLYLDHPVVLTLDNDGKFLGAAMADLATEAARLFPNLPPDQITTVFSPARLAQKERQTWEREVFRFIGREVKPGNHWEDRRRLTPGPGVPKEAFVLTVVSKVENSGDRLLATIFVFESSDADLLDKLTGVTPDDLDAPEITDFLDWNISPLPLAKRAMRMVIDARTMRRVEAESVTVQVAEIPDGLRTQTEHETLIYEEAAAPGVGFRLPR